MASQEGVPEGSRADAAANAAPAAADAGGGAADKQPAGETAGKQPAGDGAAADTKKKDKEGGKKKGKSRDNDAKAALKVPKGMRDFDPLEMAIRERVIGRVRSHFERHGAVTIETPVMELYSTLMGKYGEDTKLIYELKDQGGECLALRYDLTVPFARYLALHRVSSIKRYHISRVYRRDMPSVARGRFREFYQCDFDIAGNGAPMVADAECVKLMAELLTDLPIGGFLIKLNHRGLLDGMLEVCGVDEADFRPVCSAIDKLDKEPWDKVRAELIAKGCTEETCDLIQGFVVLNGEPAALHAEIVASGRFASSERAVQALQDLDMLCQYMAALNIPEGAVRLDLSLARGLDYYTGVIFEAVLTDGGSKVGSICGGGRYDTLMGMFLPNPKNGVPCVGFSLGLERIFAIVEERERAAGVVRASKTDVLVASVGKGMVGNRLAVLARLWDAGIAAEHMLQPNPDLRKQLGKADTDGTPVVVLVGEDEWARGAVKIKLLATKAEEEVAIGELVDAVRRAITAAAPAEAMAE
jgi:histidyl-tRNA synthetase